MQLDEFCITLIALLPVYSVSVVAVAISVSRFDATSCLRVATISLALQI